MLESAAVFTMYHWPSQVHVINLLLNNTKKIKITFLQQSLNWHVKIKVNVTDKNYVTDIPCIFYLYTLNPIQLSYLLSVTKSTRKRK